MSFLVLLPGGEEPSQRADVRSSELEQWPEVSRPFLVLLPGGEEQKQPTLIRFDELEQWPEVSKLVSIMICQYCDCGKLPPESRLEQPLLVLLVKFIAEVLKAGGYQDSTSYPRMYSLHEMHWHKDSIDFVLMRYPELLAHISVHDDLLKKRLKTVEGLTLIDDDVRIRIAMTIFRVAWLSVATKPDVDKLISRIRKRVPKQQGHG